MSDRTPLDQSDAVIYCDPPYASAARLAPGKGYRHDDDGTLWSQLVEVLSQVQHAAVILGGYPRPEADELDWQTVSLKHVRTAQVRKGGTLKPAPETLWLSPAVPKPVPCLLTMGSA